MSLQNANPQEVEKILVFSFLTIHFRKGETRKAKHSK